MLSDSHPGPRVTAHCASGRRASGNRALERRIFVVAGETSGDLHGGALLRELKRELARCDPSIVLRASGLGGANLRAEGLEPLPGSEPRDLSGLVEVLWHVPRVWLLLRRCTHYLAEQRPDALLLIDYGGFNLRLARRVRRLGLPVVYYSAPQVWAWRRYRIRHLAAYVDLLFVLFPFEEALYRGLPLETRFLGHPLVGQEPSPAEVARLKAQLTETPGADALENASSKNAPFLALLPGSRPKEIARLLPTMLTAIALLAQRGVSARYLLPTSDEARTAAVRRIIADFEVQNRQLPLPPIHVVQDAFLASIERCSFAVAASGTATLQLALAKVPFVVVYAVSPLTYRLVRVLSPLERVCIVNIIAGEEVVPELLQEHFTPQKLAETVHALLNDPARLGRMREQCAAVVARLGRPGAYRRAAQIIARRWIEPRRRV